VHAAYDPPSTFASSCAAEVSSMLVSINCTFFEIQGPKACKSEIHKHLLNFSTDTHGFFNYGHGSEVALFGYKGEVILDMSCAHLLRRKICYVISCLAAKEFGRKVISNGGICFLGFGGDFEYSPFYEEIFRACANSGAKAMIQKKTTAGEAFKIMKETFDNAMSNLVKDSNNGNWIVLLSLFRDRDYLRLLGDGSASLW